MAHLCIEYGGICRCEIRISAPYVPLWGDEAYEAELEYFRSESPLQKEARLAAEASAEAAAEASAEAFKMATYAQIQGVKNLRPTGRGRERAIGKQNKPCCGLYCDEKAPKSTWRKNAEGKLCAPMLKAITGSQCWAHEYVDPKTKALKKPHTCSMLHPGEDGWCAEWETDRNWAPSAADGFFAQRMVPAAAQGRVQTPPKRDAASEAFADRVFSRPTPTTKPTAW